MSQADATTTTPHHAHEHGHGHGHDHEHPPHLAHHFDTPAQQFESGKLGMWVFLATEILMFGGLFCAYAIYRGMHPLIFLYGHHYLDTTWGAINTVVLIVSSFTMAWGVRAAQLGQRRLLIWMLVLTFVGGCGFMAIKAREYQLKFSHHLGPGTANLFYQAAYPNAPATFLEDPAAEVTHLEDLYHFPSDNGHGAPHGEQAAHDNGGTAGGADTAAEQAQPSAEQTDSDAQNTETRATGEPDTAAQNATAQPTGPTTDADGLPGPPESSSASTHSAAPAGLRETVIERHAEAAQVAEEGDGHGTQQRFTELPQSAQSRVHIFFQTYFMMTGLHGLHVLIGMALIAWIGIRALKNHFSPQYYTPVEIVGLYWHLVDLIWIFLFPLLYLIH